MHNNIIKTNFRAIQKSTSKKINITQLFSRLKQNYHSESLVHACSIKLVGGGCLQARPSNRTSHALSCRTVNSGEQEQEGQEQRVSGAMGLGDLHAEALAKAREEFFLASQSYGGHWGGVTVMRNRWGAHDLVQRRQPRGEVRRGEPPHTLRRNHGCTSLETSTPSRLLPPLRSADTAPGDGAQSASLVGPLSLWFSAPAGTNPRRTLPQIQPSCLIHPVQCRSYCCEQCLWPLSWI